MGKNGDVEMKGLRWKRERLMDKKFKKRKQIRWKRDRQTKETDRMDKLAQMEGWMGNLTRSQTC